MLTILKRIFLHWRTTLEGLGFGSIAWLLTDHGVQFTIQRGDKLIPTVITIMIMIYKLFSTDPVNKPASAKPDPVIGSQVRSLCLSILILTVLGLSSAIGAQAQDKPVKAQVEIAAFTVTNDRGQIPDNIGLGIAGGINLFRRIYVGAEAYGDHDDPGGGKTRVRTRYFGTFKFYELGGLDFSAGAGGGKTGNEAFGFGQFGIGVPAIADFNVFGRYGNQNAIEADGSLAIADSEHWTLRGFYRYSKIKIANQNVEQQIAGVRLVIK